MSRREHVEVNPRQPRHRVRQGEPRVVRCMCDEPAVRVREPQISGHHRLPQVGLEEQHAAPSVLCQGSREVDRRDGLAVSSTRAGDRPRP